MGMLIGIGVVVAVGGWRFWHLWHFGSSGAFPSRREQPLDLSGFRVADVPKPDADPNAAHGETAGPGNEDGTGAAESR